jgi:hypothetical protein
MGWFGFCFERERLSAELQAQLSLQKIILNAMSVRAYAQACGGIRE